MRGPSMGTVEDPYSAHFHHKSTGRNPGGARPVGGPRMSQPASSGFRHQPVMVTEIVELFDREVARSLPLSIQQWADVQKAFVTGVQSVIAGQANVQDAMKQSASDINKLLKPS